MNTPKIIIDTDSKCYPNPDPDLKYHQYGWKRFRWSGCLSRPTTAYIILCICTFIQNFSVNGANNAVISTLERVFYLNSVQSGLFLALYDLATVLSSPLIGHLGNRYSSPIFFSLNMVIVGIGNLLIASSNFVPMNADLNFNPQLLVNSTTYNNILFQCTSDFQYAESTKSPMCSRYEKLSIGVQNAKALLYLGNFVNGFGSVALFTVGISYIERIFPREKAAYCQGIYFAVGTVGGALGIVATGRFLQLHTRLISRNQLPFWLTPTHPLWIGCWWLPYIIYGIMCFLIGVFVSGLPNFERPGIQVLSQNHPSTTQNPYQISRPKTAKMSIDDSQTTSSYLSSRPPSPTLISDSSVTLSDSRDTVDIDLPVLQSISNEYRHSGRKSQQFTVISSEPNLALTLPADSYQKDGSVNHAYSTESMSRQWSSDDISKATQLNKIETKGTIKTASSNVIPVHKTVSENIRQMCSIILELLKNPRYLFIIIANLFEGILVKGFVPFITKYFEYQHQLDTSTATLITGAIALLSVIIGCPVGACLINKLGWTPMRCARACCVVLLMSSFLFLFLILTCPELKFENTSCTSKNNDCCHNKYHPVCQIDKPNLMYLSPCHFGCTIKLNSTLNNTNYYSSCSCANNTAVLLSETACRFKQIPCVLVFGLTMGGAMLVVFLTALIQVPMLQVLLYSIPFSYQSMALGLRQTIVRVFGQTTGPLLFGLVFDQTCLIWLTDCYSRRTCKVYDNRRMGLSMALSGFSTRFISGLACGLVVLHWKLKKTDATISSRH